MISHTHNFIYFRNAKTASHSILNSFGKNKVDYSNIGYYEESTLYEGFLKTYYQHHLNSSILKREIQSDNFNNYFKFGFVRNPWDKMISLWLYIEDHNFYSFLSDHTVGIQARRNYSFWDKYSGSSMEEYVDLNKLCPTKISFECFLLYFFNTDMKVIFESGSSFNKHADFIGKYENLQDDFNFICDKINIPRSKLKFKNKSKRFKNYKKYYNERTKNLVGDIFYDDIKKFNYIF